MMNSGMIVSLIIGLGLAGLLVEVFRMACEIGNVRVPVPFDKRDRREWRKDPCDPRYVSIEKIYYANGNSLNCKGCGALIEAGDGNCPWCDRGYRA